MGIVYEAEDRTLGRRVAVKVLTAAPPEHDDEWRRRFLREARSAAALTHPNIAAIHEVGEDEGRPFIVMELVPGRTLRALLADRPLPMPEAVRLAVAMAQGLSAAHAAGIVHRDLKPDNVMVVEGGAAKLLDFGLAKCVSPGAPALTVPDDDWFTTTGQGPVCGTPAYMSPEQILGRKVDARSDVFSFGVMLYEMVTGKRPFGGRSRQDPVPPSRVVAAIPDGLERLILRCLCADPRERYADGAALLADLEALKNKRRKSTLLSWTVAAVAAGGLLSIGFSIPGSGGHISTPSRPPVVASAQRPAPEPSAASPAPEVAASASSVCPAVSAAPPPPTMPARHAPPAGAVALPPLPQDLF
jgi:serine/threonine-protein kinase